MTHCITYEGSNRRTDEKYRLANGAPRVCSSTVSFVPNMFPKVLSHRMYMFPCDQLLPPNGEGYVKSVGLFVCLSATLRENGLWIFIKFYDKSDMAQESIWIIVGMFRSTLGYMLSFPIFYYPCLFTENGRTDFHAFFL